MSGGEITGNTSSSSSSRAAAASSSHAYGGGVYMAGGTFTMNGGEISDNNVSSYASYTSSYSYSSGGGVYVGGGTFTMSSGEISDNTTSSSGGGGVFVDNGGTFTMSGGARVNVNNSVCLYDYTGSSSYPSITIGGDFSGPAGPVAQIDLMVNNDTPWSTWLGLQVIKTDYSGDLAVLRNRFTLGNFIGQTYSSGSYTYPTWPITDTGYEIGSDGTLRAVTP
jgi:hypothetical protein